jgi:hypothetical protein
LKTPTPGQLQRYDAPDRTAFFSLSAFAMSSLEGSSSSNLWCLDDRDRLFLPSGCCFLFTRRSSQWSFGLIEGRFDRKLGMCIHLGQEIPRTHLWCSHHRVKKIWVRVFPLRSERESIDVSAVFSPPRRQIFGGPSVP